MLTPEDVVKILIKVGVAGVASTEKFCYVYDDGEISEYKIREIVALINAHFEKESQQLREQLDASNRKIEELQDQLLAAEERVGALEYDLECTIDELSRVDV